MDEHTVEYKLMKAWNIIDVQVNERRQERRAAYEVLFGDRPVLVQMSIALCHQGIEVLAETSTAKNPTLELLFWTLAGAIDSFREFMVGNLPGAIVLYRAVVEGHAVLGAIVADDTLAQKFAAFDFVGQADARSVVDHTNPKFEVALPDDISHYGGPNTLSEWYQMLSSLAHPTRHAAFLQSEPEVHPGDDVNQVSRSWVLSGGAWPTSTNEFLQNLNERVLSLVDIATLMPMPESEKTSFLERRQALSLRAREAWSERHAGF